MKSSEEHGDSPFLSESLTPKQIRRLSDPDTVEQRVFSALRFNRDDPRRQRDGQPNRLLERTDGSDYQSDEIFERLDDDNLDNQSSSRHSLKRARFDDDEAVDDETGNEKREKPLDSDSFSDSFSTDNSFHCKKRLILPEKPSESLDDSEGNELLLPLFNDVMDGIPRPNFEGADKGEDSSPPSWSNSPNQEANNNLPARQLNNQQRTSPPPFQVMMIGGFRSPRLSPAAQKQRRLNTVNQHIGAVEAMLTEWANWKLAYFDNRYCHYTSHNKENFLDHRRYYGLVNLDLTHSLVEKVKTIRQAIEKYIKNELSLARTAVAQLKSSNDLTVKLEAAFKKTVTLLQIGFEQAAAVVLNLPDLGSRHNVLKVDDGCQYIDIQLTCKAKLAKTHLNVSALLAQYKALTEAHDNALAPWQKKLSGALKQFQASEKQDYRSMLEDTMKTCRQEIETEITAYQNAVESMHQKLDSIRVSVRFVEKLHNYLQRLGSDDYSADNIDLKLARTDIQRLIKLINNIMDLKTALAKVMGRPLPARYVPNNDAFGELAETQYEDVNDIIRTLR